MGSEMCIRDRNGCVVDEARQRKIAESLQEALGSGDVARHPSPMMSADPVRVLYPPGQLEQEYRTELKKVQTTQFSVLGPSLPYSVIMHALLQPVMSASSYV